LIARQLQIYVGKIVLTSTFYDDFLDTHRCAVLRLCPLRDRRRL
jgi:hypothetical protein